MKLVAAALATATLLALGTGAHAQQTITIRLANAACDPHPFYKAGEAWKEEVEKRSKGRVKVQYLGCRALGEDRQIVEGTMAGTIDATVCATISLTVLAKVPAFEALQLPFLISSYDTLAKVLSSPAAAQLMDDLAPAGLKGITLFEGGQRNYLSSKGPVLTVEDFKGLKTRVMNMPLYLAIWNAAGASPVGMNYGEIYTSLQTHVIDAVEINVSSVESEHFWEVAKDFTYTGHYFFPGAIVYNKKKFDALPPDIQKIMVEAGHDIIVPQVMQTKADEQVVAKKLEARGVKFYHFKELDKMRKIEEPVIQDRMAKYPSIKAFVETVRKIDAGG